MTLAPGTRVGVYDIDALLGAGGPPPFAHVAHRANYGEVSSAFAAKRLRRDHAEAHSGSMRSGGGPKPSTRTRE